MTTTTTPEPSTPSLLDAVARHEAALLAELEAAEQEGQALIDAAQHDAASAVQKAQQALEAELAELRRKAAEARAAEVHAIETAARDKVEEIRRNAGDRLEAARDAVRAMILPAQREGA